MLNACYDVRRKDLDYAAIRKLRRQWKQTAPYFTGDYYPLTPCSTSRQDWIGWQFDRPDLGEGMAQAFRRDESVYLSAAFPLRGLETNARYRVTNLDTEVSEDRDGHELMEQGLTVAIAAKPGSALLVYRKLKGSGS